MMFPLKTGGLAMNDPLPLSANDFISIAAVAGNAMEERIRTNPAAPSASFLVKATLLEKLLQFESLFSVAGSIVA
jgi:hypothetical protein